MNSKSTFNSFLLVALLVTMGAGGIQARNRPTKARSPLANLELTSEQKESIREIHKSRKSDRETNVNQMISLRENIKTELLKENPSRETLTRYSAELGELHKVINQRRIGYLLELKEILTEEQFAQIAESKQRPSQFRGHKGQRRRSE
ncbi:periplasmic heavy metal sensor [Chitinispirillales bacterium ANBcel5]|uniref:Spy/CpxP family protein refolding chaperone n=1 Tax=Cellulosispirillum alkaliphilum TaxID=3039283 RepID=UPI002A50273A|nr:periplasmic heavy metal sensor [Chitinispirillales bacterium ANBcel5]